MLYRERATKIMEKWWKEGVKEVPPGSNWGGFVSYINRYFGRAPWCQAAVCESFRLAGRSIIRTNTVTVYWDWAKRMGYTVPVSQALRGDQVVFEWDGYWSDRGWYDTLDHVATVRLREGQTITVVEGNSSDRMRGDRQFSIYSRVLKGAVRIPGGEVDPKAAGAPYVSKAYPLPRLVQKTAQEYVVKLGRKVLFRGPKGSATRFYKDKLSYWKRRNETRP